MEALTLFLAAIAVLVVFASRPVYGLTAYLALLLLYPDYLRASLGSVDISACRIVVVALLLRCATDPMVMRRFHWKTLDTCVLLSMFIFSLTLAFTTPFEVWLENRTGFFMDTFLVYLACRFVVADRESFVVLAKGIAIMTVFLAIHGINETFTGQSLYMGLGQYCPWAPTKGMGYQTRFDLNRAMGPSGETIMFGLTFAASVPLIWQLRLEHGLWGRLGHILALFGVLGVVSTVSSGPLLALLVTGFVLVLQRFKSLVVPTLILAVVGCVAIEMLSNRHFYYVLADFTMDGESGWYRARLIDVAILKLPEYWAHGYGFGDPGWGPLIDERPRSDGVNDFIIHAVLYGIFGLGIYVITISQAIAGTIRSYRRAATSWLKSLDWGLCASLVGLLAAFWSVSLFGQTVSFFYFLLGLHGAVASSKRATHAFYPAQAAHRWIAPSVGLRPPNIPSAIGREAVS